MRYIILLAMFVAGCATNPSPVPVGKVPVGTVDGEALFYDIYGISLKKWKAKEEAERKDKEDLERLVQDYPCFDRESATNHALQLDNGKWMCVIDLKSNAPAERQKEMREYEWKINDLQAELKRIEQSDHSEESLTDTARRLDHELELMRKVREKRKYLEILREKAYPGYAARLKELHEVQMRINDREQKRKEQTDRIQRDRDMLIYGGGRGGCGSRGGPGIRGANGKCKSWKSLGR